MDEPVDPASLQDLARVERRLRERKSYLECMGVSRCRLCGQHNGGDEFVIKGRARWPSGCVHCMRDHRVHPPPDFVREIRAAAI